MRLVAKAGGFALVLALAACSSERTVDKTDLAGEVSRQVSSSAGTTPESVTCPADLPAKVDETTTCRLTDSGTSYDVRIRVTKVDGSDVAFDIKVADQPS